METRTEATSDVVHPKPITIPNDIPEMSRNVLQVYVSQVQVWGIRSDGKQPGHHRIQYPHFLGPLVKNLISPGNI